MGGSQYQARMLIDHLVAQEKYEIYYLARSTCEAFMPDGYAIRRIAEPKGIRRYGEFLDAPDLLRILKEISPEIIYQRVGCGYTGITAYYAKKNNKRCVWHVAHDREVMPLNVRLARNLVFRYVDKKFLEYGLRNVNAIITQTQQQADYLWKYYGRKEDAIIPNAHPFPGENMKKGKAIRVVWVANLKPWKHPEIFIRLARDLQQMDQVKFTMIGKPLGNPAWCKKIQEEADKAANLEYLGEQTQEAVNKLLAEAHIFVNTSEHEGFANTFIQAWLRKVPVLSLSVNPDGIFDEQHIGIHAGTYENLKHKLIQLIDDETLISGMGEKAQNYASEQFSVKNMEQLERIIMGTL